MKSEAVRPSFASSAAPSFAPNQSLSASVPITTEAPAAPVETLRHRILLLATDFVTPYRVLRCIQATGAEVYVLGNSGAGALRLSRHCRHFAISGHIIHGARDEELALEINCFAKEFGITLVVPADAPSARFLIASQDLIRTTCFALPRLEHFDALNNKWSFTQLCKQLGLRHPETRLFPDLETLRDVISSGGVEFPSIVKPLDRCAGAGIKVLGDPSAQLNTINYRPILMQTFIPGEDIGASIFARGGKIEAFLAHRLHRGVYSTFHDGNIHADLAKLVEHLGLDGVYNFDMITALDGSTYYLECNPRFFYKINLSMIAGINFVEWGIPGGRPSAGAVPSGTAVRFPKALLRSLLSLHRCSIRDWQMARYLLSDPWPLLFEKLKVLS